MIAGYFDPDYGDIYPKENSEEIISKMLKNHDKIIGGFIMVPFVKFGLFDTDLETDIDYVENQIISVHARLKKWKEFLSDQNLNVHFIRISHTDQDMLTISFPLKFSQPTPLEKKDLGVELTPILDSLQKLNLL